jgi:hypothetical protein
LRVTGKYRVSLIAALFFALHPLHTENVSNVAGRKDIISPLFLISLHFYTKADPYQPESSAHPRTSNTLKFFAASLALFFLALLSKENTVTLMGAVAAFYPIYQYEWGRKTDGSDRVKRFAKFFTGYLLIVLLYLIVRWLVLGQILVTEVNFMEVPTAFEPFWVRLFTGLKILGKYVSLLIFPWTLTIDYSYNQIPVSRTLMDLKVLVPMLLTVLSFTAAIRYRIRPKEILYILLFFFVTYSITSNIVISSGVIMTERHLYLPSVAYCMLLGIIYDGIWRKTVHKRWIPVLIILLSAHLSFYSYRTVTRNRDWQSNYTLFASAVKASPRSAKAHIALAINRHNHGFLDYAVMEYKKALEIKPDAIDARTNLAVAYGQKGLLDRSIRELKIAAALAPHDPLPHKNLVYAYGQKGMTADAEKELAIYHRLIGNLQMGK